MAGFHKAVDVLSSRRLAHLPALLSLTTVLLAVSGCAPGFFTLRYDFPPTVQTVGLLVVEGHSSEMVFGTKRLFGPLIEANIRYVSTDDSAGGYFNRVIHITKIHPGKPIGKVPSDYYADADIVGPVIQAFKALLQDKGKQVVLFNDRITQADLQGRKVSEVVKTLGRQARCDQIWVVHGYPGNTVSFTTHSGGLGVYVPMESTTTTGPGINYVMAAGIFDPTSGKMLLKFNHGGTGVMNNSALAPDEFVDFFAESFKNSFERVVFQ